MKAFIQLFSFLLLIQSVSAQRICGSVDYTQTLISQHPSIKAAIEKAANEVNATLRNGATLRGRDTAANELINIPVVIHVLYASANGPENISDAQIQSQLDALNNDFSNKNSDRVNTPAAFKSAVADCRIKFCLAQVDPQGKRTTGITRKLTSINLFSADDAMKVATRGGTNAWDAKRYLNIWVCALNGRSLGYATAPGGPADLDGVVIAYDVFGTVGNVRSPFNKGRTATHEIGHWLGLQHIWGDTDCGDDGIDDTPRQKSYNFGCPSFPRVTSCSETATGDMFMNFMDFSDDACMNMFTNGQKKRMRALFASNNSRNSFLTSFACDSNLVQAGPVPGVTPVADTTVAPAFSIYPNPVSTVVTIESKSTTTAIGAAVRIYNAVGICVFKGSTTQQKTSFNLSNLPAGLYFIQIGEGSNKYSSKLVKQ